MTARRMRRASAVHLQLLEAAANPVTLARLSLPEWAAFGYIAAESDLARQVEGR